VTTRHPLPHKYLNSYLKRRPLSADGGENKAFFPTYQEPINTTPIARGEEAAHTYATFLPSLSLDTTVGLGQHAASVPRIVDNIQAASYHGELPADSSFTLFPKLPPEIRLNIWRHALSIPRIVEIDFDKNWFYSSRTLPPLLSCNHESRIECLNAYSTCNDIVSQWIQFD
jgi:hypothetical protein